MRPVDVFGALVIAGILVLLTAGLMAFVLASEIPLIYRAGTGFLMFLLLAVMVYVIRDRMKDIKKEKQESKEVN